MQLISRSQAGDEAAFTELFEQYKNLVFKTAYLMLDNPAEAEDALQEVFVLIHKGLRGFDPRKGAFTTWLYSITVHYCLNHRRKRSFVSLPLEAAEEAPSSEAAGTSLAEEEAIRQAVSALSEKQRAVVILRYYWELPYAEISRILNIPLGTVKSRLDLALRTLRRTLEAEDKELESRSAPKLEANQ